MEGKRIESKTIALRVFVGAVAPVSDPDRQPKRDDRERARHLDGKASPPSVRQQPDHGRDRIHIPPTVYSTISPSIAY
jgi:hypothetical protein